NTVSNSKDQETLKDSEKTFDDVQAAIDAASSGSVIYLNGTTYNFSKTIQISKSNLTIDGGFEDGAGISILDGNGAGKMLMQVKGSNIILKNIKFMNGGVAYVTVNGGAINWAKNTQNATVVNCMFINNSANAGGAINSQCVNLNVYNCLFENNRGNMMSGAFAAGIGSVSTISNCTFKGNTAITGGAIAGVSSTALNVDNCTFIDNYATNAAAINLQKAALNVSNSNFENNTAKKRGGAITTSQAKDKISTIANCSFSQNNATDGGAIIVTQSNFVIDNSTFSNNSADCGGGLVVEGASTVNITQSEFVGNDGNIV
ncbi:right-handed parallel beta-helix repeat-containing protein, partial [Methanobrevibacter sp.]